jgi:hypothetical protein
MSTIKQRIETVAADADLNPQAAALLNNFFLNLASQAEKNALDLWLNEREANSELFDLLLDVNKDGTGAGTMALLTLLTKKTPRKMSRFSKISWLLILLILLVVLVDYLIPIHPINRWLYGKEHGDPNIGAVTVTTTDETKPSGCQTARV